MKEALASVLWVSSIGATITVLAVLFLVFWVLRRQQQAPDAGQNQRRLAVMEHLLPNRVAAYERLMLYIDRIHPTNLLKRHTLQGKTGPTLQQELMRSVAEEFDHNVVQQLYVSERSWTALLNARTAVLETLNGAGEGLSREGTARAYAERLQQFTDADLDRTLGLVGKSLRQDLQDYFNA